MLFSGSTDTSAPGKIGTDLRIVCDGYSAPAGKTNLLIVPSRLPSADSNQSKRNAKPDLSDPRTVWPLAGAHPASKVTSAPRMGIDVSKRTLPIPSLADRTLVSDLRPNSTENPIRMCGSAVRDVRGGGGARGPDAGRRAGRRLPRAGRGLLGAHAGPSRSPPDRRRAPRATSTAMVSSTRPICPCWSGTSGVSEADPYPRCRGARHRLTRRRTAPYRVPRALRPAGGDRWIACRTQRERAGLALAGRG